MCPPRKITVGLLRRACELPDHGFLVTFTVSDKWFFLQNRIHPVRKCLVTPYHPPTMETSRHICLCCSSQGSQLVRLQMPPNPSRCLGVSISWYCESRTAGRKPPGQYGHHFSTPCGQCVWVFSNRLLPAVLREPRAVALACIILASALFIIPFLLLTLVIF